MGGRWNVGGRVTDWTEACESCKGYPDCPDCTCTPALTPPARPSAISIAQAVQAEQERQDLAASACECLDDALAFIELMEKHHGFPVFAGELTADAILRIRSWAGRT